MHQSMTLYTPKCCALPEKLAYTFLKSKTWVYYSLKFITSESTKQTTVLESISGHRVAANLHFFPVLGHSQVPTLALGQKLLFSGKGSGQRLELTQHQLHTHTLHQLTLCLPQLPLWYWAIKPLHTASLPENTSTANQEHCSFPLCLQFPSEVKHWHGADQLKHTQHCSGWSSTHYLFLPGDLTLSFFWQWEQNREQITQSLALEPKAESEWHIQMCLGRVVFFLCWFFLPF